MRDKTEWQAIRRGSITPPNGESFDCVAKRIGSFWRQFVVLDLLHGRDVLMVLHGNGLAAMVAEVEGLPKSKVLRLNPDHTTLYVYKFEPVFEPGHSHLRLLAHRTLDAAPLMEESFCEPVESAAMSLTMA